MLVSRGDFVSSFNWAKYWGTKMSNSILNASIFLIYSSVLISCSTALSCFVLTWLRRRQDLTAAWYLDCAPTHTGAIMAQQVIKHRKHSVTSPHETSLIYCSAGGFIIFSINKLYCDIRATFESSQVMCLQSGQTTDGEMFVTAAEEDF